MASEHPKITAYIPQDVLDALDAWKQAHALDSRNAAFVAILRDYLGVTHLVTHPVTHSRTFPHNDEWSAVLEAIETLTQRMDAVEAVLSTLPSTLLGTLPDDVPGEALPATVESLPPVGETESDTLTDEAKEAIAPLSQGIEEVNVNSASDAELKPKPTLPLGLKPPLSQKELGERLGLRYPYYLQKHRERGKEHFEAWSQSVDPDGISWTFDEPKRPRRGRKPTANKALKFYPKV